MGKLSTFTPITKEVKVSGDQTITVRGLSITDIGRIIHAHADILDSLYQEHIVGTSDDTPEVDTLIKALMTEAPTAVAAMIAAANDEPDAIDVVLSMPGMDQVQLLITVAELTFHSEEEVKKMMESLIRGMAAVTNVVNPPMQELQ